MKDLLEIYTRLKTKLGDEITITYYHHGYKRTREVKLLDIEGFNNIQVKDAFATTSIPFFGMEAMIESITLNNSEQPLYYNPYVNKDIFDGFYIKKGYSEKIKEKLIGDISFDIENRNKFIQKYNAKIGFFDYDELFFSNKQKQEFNEFFELLVKDITRYCKNKGLDTNLTLISKGTTSLIYSIGDKIIKIGKPRRTSFIPYCEHILQPIINKDYEFDGYPIHVEVTQKVIVCETIDNGWGNKKFTDLRDDLAEQLYLIGLRSTDLHPANIGILTEDNKIHFDSINFLVSNEDVSSIQTNNNLRVKRKGELVLIDLDCLEIEDINKYCSYLRKLGFNEDKIKNIKNDYNAKKPRKI